MIYKAYSIYDSKVGSYMQPFFVRSKGEAIRMVMNELTREDSNLTKYPADFTLFEIGEYDDSNGNLSTPEVGPTNVGVLIEFTKES
jgi:hypothetical protein